MSKLNFASINEAYSIGSEQIKKTQDEIAKLRKIVESSSTGSTGSTQNTNEDIYKRIGLPDRVNALFCGDKPPSQNTQNAQDDDFDYSFFKLMKNPKFEDIIKNYIQFKHTEWLLSETRYS